MKLLLSKTYQVRSFGLLSLLGLCGATGVGPSHFEFPLNRVGDTPYEMRPVYPLLRFERPVHLAFWSEDPGHAYVTEKAGRILRFARSNDQSSSSLVIDLTTRVFSDDNEMGLLSLAFDPHQSGRFFVVYTRANPVRLVLEAYQMRADKTADPESAELILEQQKPEDGMYHNGGLLGFGPDGNLYVAFGDGGEVFPAQQGDSLLGKMLRIDVRAREGARPYRIPPDNPFISNRRMRPEIWALGLRNPWRWSFDRVTGELWLGDVGQDRLEEVNLIKAGRNYGWPYFEGSLAYRRPSPEPFEFYEAPVFEYGRPPGFSVMGGFVYRGTELPALVGKYIFADYGPGTFWALERDESGALLDNPLDRELARLPSIVSFAEDERGELFGVSLFGSLYKLVAAEAPQPGEQLPTRLSESGLFTDLSSLSPAPGLLPYEVNSPLWSDGALKQRWISLPAGSRIGFASKGPWTFPIGSLFVKHFEIMLEGGRRKRLETRVMVHHRQGWAGYTYRWNAAGTDAELLHDSQSETLRVEIDGQRRTQRWYYPSRGDCLSCHTQAAGFVLGARTEQLNRETVLEDGPMNQLIRLQGAGFLDELPDPSTLPRYADPSDPQAELAHRARSYLAVNCSQCHMPLGPTPTNFDLRAQIPIADTRLLRVRPTEGDLNIRNAYRIGDSKERSLVWERMRRLDEKRMPKLGTSVLDELGIGVVGDWIDAGSPDPQS